MYEEELELSDKYHDLPGGKRQTNWIPLILAILIVTSCVIPLIVLFIILAIIKAFWGLDVMSSLRNAKLPKAGRRRRSKSAK